MFLSDLPHEVVEFIVAHALSPAAVDDETQLLSGCVKQDAIAIRSSCRKFNALDTPADVLFGQFNLHSAWRSYKNLMNLATSRKLRDRVVSVCIWQPLFESQYWKEDFYAKTFRSKNESRNDWTETLVESSWSIAQGLIEDQRDIERNYAGQYLSALLGCLPRLRTLGTQFEQPHSKSGNTLDLSKPGYLGRHHPEMHMDRLDRSSRNKNKPGDKRVLQVLALSCKRSSVTSLKLSTLTQKFACAFGERLKSDSIQIKLKKLVELHLQIDQYSMLFDQEADIPTFPWHHFQRNTNGRQIRQDCSHVLEPFLTGLDRIRTLIIGPSDVSKVRSDHRWTCDALKWSTFDWPGLRSLTIRDAWLEYEDLCPFLGHHIIGLQELILSDIRFGIDHIDAWREIFPLIRESSTLHSFLLFSDPNVYAQNGAWGPGPRVSVASSDRTPVPLPPYSFHDLFDGGLNPALTDYLTNAGDWTWMLQEWWYDPRKDAESSDYEPSTSEESDTSSECSSIDSISEAELQCVLQFNTETIALHAAANPPPDDISTSESDEWTDSDGSEPENSTQYRMTGADILGDDARTDIYGS